MYSCATLALVFKSAFQATNFDYIETSAGNTSEVTHSYVTTLHPSLCSEIESTLNVRISVIIVSRMMLNIMEAADRRVNNDHESNEESLETDHNLSVMHFTTHFNPEYSTFATNSLGPSILGQRQSIFGHDSPEISPKSRIGAQNHDSTNESSDSEPYAHCELQLTEV